MDRFGKAVPTFPKAKYFIQKHCWEEATHPDERFRNAIYNDDFLPLEEKGMVELMDGDDEIIPVLNVKVTDGPSVGHQIVLVERGSERIAYVGDLIPTPHHLYLPCISALDVNPDLTLVQKRMFLEMTVEGGWLIVFGHGYEHHSGYIVRREGKPRLLPANI